MKPKLRMFKKAFQFLSKMIINNENYRIVSYVKKKQKIKILKFLKRKIKK